MSVIIDIDHEDGTLGEWTTTYIDLGDLSCTAAAGLAGTGYGMQALIDDTTAIYGRVQITADTSGTWRMRYYFDPNTLTMANNNLFTIFIVENSAGTSYISMYLKFLTASGYQVAARLYNDDASNTTSAYYVITDEPHYFELAAIRASGESTNDGSLQFWIDGASKETLSGKDNYNSAADLYRVYLGPVGGIDAGTTGTCFFDQLVVNNDGGTIGPYVSPSTFQPRPSFALADMAVY